MRALRREWYEVTRGDTFTIVPLGDIHLGAGACDEDYLQRIVNRIRHDDRCWWIGMGDYCDFIQLKDPRFDAGTLADWMYTKDAITDPMRAQKDAFLEIVAPIAKKCLGLVKGNHEDSLQRHHERDIYGDIAHGIREQAGRPGDYRMQLQYAGWLRLMFYRAAEAAPARATSLTVKTHHGYGGGRTPGPKMNRLSDLLKDCNADLVIMGHVHDTATRAVATEFLNANDEVCHYQRIGVISGTCLRSTMKGREENTYSEKAGYSALEPWGMEIAIKPGEDDPRRRIRVSTLDV